jgi:hypothetical protein
MIPDSPADGERRKLEAHDLLEARRATYLLLGRRALLARLLDRGGTATADDVRGAVELPPGIDPKLFGRVPGPLARLGLIKRAGFVKTTRPTAHARLVSAWQLLDRRAALAWLAEHSAPPPETPNATAATVASDTQIRTLFDPRGSD